MCPTFLMRSLSGIHLTQISWICTSSHHAHKPETGEGGWGAVRKAAIRPWKKWSDGRRLWNKSETLCEEYMHPVHFSCSKFKECWKALDRSVLNHCVRRILADANWQLLTFLPHRILFSPVLARYGCCSLLSVIRIGQAIRICRLKTHLLSPQKDTFISPSPENLYTH